MPEMMKLFRNIKIQITKIEDREKKLNLEITEIVLLHFNAVSNYSLLDSGVLYTFVSNKSFGQLLDNSPKYFIFLETLISDFSQIEV